MGFDCDQNLELSSDFGRLKSELGMWSRIRKFPLQAIFELTPLCNLRCPMCYVRLDKSHMALQGKLHSAKEWLELARQSAEMGLLFVTVTGGEPLLHPEFWDIYNGLTEMGILVTINSEKDTIVLTSFLRDMYVMIPGYFKEKINAAYMLGGMDLLNATLYENFGVVVDHNVEVSFSQFTEIIDYLGGIDLELTQKEADFVNKAMGKGAAQLVEGMNHLNGHRALAYARYRKDATGDFGRTERQRKTINAVIEKYKDSDLTTMIGMVNKLMGMITTNMTKTEILGYAVKYFPMLASAEIVSQRVPFDGKHTNNKDYYYMNKVDEISVVVPNLKENREKLAETLS